MRKTKCLFVGCHLDFLIRGCLSNLQEGNSLYCVVCNDDKQESVPISRKLDYFNLLSVMPALRCSVKGLEEEEIMARNKERALLLQDLKNKKNILCQKAKMKWAKFGDINSAFYHRMINGRRLKNEIPGLEIQGLWCNDPSTVKIFVKETFENHFKDRRMPRIGFSRESVRRQISEVDRRRLVEPFYENEILTAVKDCDGDKSPGPDALSMQIYKVCWDIWKDDFLSRKIDESIKKCTKLPNLGQDPAESASCSWPCSPVVQNGPNFPLFFKLTQHWARPGRN
ncbi:hypothetical protein OROMI_014475 [Orobanche minor]